MLSTKNWNVRQSIELYSILFEFIVRNICTSFDQTDGYYVSFFKLNDL